MKSFFYALRDLSGSNFCEVYKSVDGLVAATWQDPLLRRKERNHVKGGCIQWAPSKKCTGENEIISKYEKEGWEKKYSSLNFFFGGINNQKRTETTTTDVGSKVKKMIETQITLYASAEVEAK